MPVTITVADVAVAIRAATSADDVPAPVTLVLTGQLKAAAALIAAYAPAAPDDVANAAAVRLTGWMYDADPTDISVSRPLQVSGAAALLGPFRVHRAGAISGPDAPAPQPTPGGGGNVPDPPALGEFVLTSVNGSLQWVAFPQP